MTKKEIATSFLKLAATGDVRIAYERHVAPQFIHHNQYFKGDRQSLMLAMEAAHESSPNESIEIKIVLKENDKVMTYSRVTRKDQSHLPIAVVHLFRIEGEKITELWDVGQQIQKDSPNEFGLF